MATSVASPIKVAPVFDAKPWGGRRLASCGIVLPNDAVIGEALLTAPDSLVSSGAAAGLSLGELASAAPDIWVGATGLAATGGRAIFPLLIKLIDASANLSVQVHPDDAFAAASDLGTGKTEAWHVLDAQPRAALYLGLRPDVRQQEFQHSCQQADGSAAHFLRRMPAEPGMTFIVPAGTLHAIGAGLVIYEIQQPSNVTFRLDDWGRRDDSGQSRQLHHDAGFAALDPTSRPAPIASVALTDDAKRTILAATRYFALERISLAPAGEIDVEAVESPQVLTCLSGDGRLSTSNDVMRITTGETVVLPARATAQVSATGELVVLRGWVPHLERDVIAPCVAAGASAEVIAQLGIGVGS